MTPTAMDSLALEPPTAIVRQADPDRWPVWGWEPPAPDRSFLQALQTVQGFHTPSSTIQFAELPSAVLPTTNDVITAVLSRMAKHSSPDFAEEAPLWDVEIELPAWKGPKGVRVQALVKKVSRGTFRPITEDDIGGM